MRRGGEGRCGVIGVVGVYWGEWEKGKREKGGG